MNPEEVGNRLKIVIKIIGIRREDIAKKLGMSYTNLTRKLSGRKEFNIKEVLGLMEVLGLDAELCSNIFFNPEYTLEDIKERIALSTFKGDSSKKKDLIHKK